MSPRTRHGRRERPQILCDPLSLLCSFAMATAAHALDEHEVNNSRVDMQKQGQSAFTRFVEHAYWPTEEAIRNARIDASALDKSHFTELQTMLQTVLSASYLPSKEALEQTTMACSDLRDEQDYLLLRYVVERKGTIEMQYGPALYLKITPMASSRVELTEVGMYVETTARRLLNIPSSQETDGPRLVSFVSAADVGDSKVGKLTWSADRDPDAHWYSTIAWWSDGRSVLFAIMRLDQVGLTDSHRPAPARRPSGKYEFRLSPSGTGT